jgi:hypothetical protein
MADRADRRDREHGLVWRAGRRSTDANIASCTQEGCTWRVVGVKMTEDVARQLHRNHVQAAGMRRSKIARRVVGHARAV